MHSPLRFIDLFAGIGGIRKGFEMACAQMGFESRCVLTSEIKTSAVTVLQQNHPNEAIYGDIRTLETGSIPDFDFLLAGFPCQAFSFAGQRKGFLDARGTLFFEIERILRGKQPLGFVLENVEGLVTHGKTAGDTSPIGPTLSLILNHLEALGYKLSWRVLNARYFGVPQNRKRIYIVGTRFAAPSLENFKQVETVLDSVLDKGLPVTRSMASRRLLKLYSLEELEGKSMKDKRGGPNNIHSWDLELRGPLSKTQKNLLNQLFLERRHRKWAEEYKIEWMDGMPLTLESIRTFFPHPKLEALLEDLVQKKYLRREHPKRKVGNKRVYDTSLPLGYNIVTGRVSFPITQILKRQGLCPTLVAMDMRHLYVTEAKGLRPLTLREGLRLCGYPDDFIFNIPLREGYSLIGNTVVVPVIKEVSLRMLECCLAHQKEEQDTDLLP